MALFGLIPQRRRTTPNARCAALAIQPRARLENHAKNAHNGMPEFARALAWRPGPVVIDAIGEIFGDAPQCRCASAGGRRTRVPYSSDERSSPGVRLFIAEERGAHELRGSLSRSNSSALCAQARGRRAAREHQRRSSAVTLSWACGTLLDELKRQAMPFCTDCGDPGLVKSRRIEAVS